MADNCNIHYIWWGREESVQKEVCQTKLTFCTNTKDEKDLEILDNAELSYRVINNTNTRLHSVLE